NESAAYGLSAFQCTRSPLFSSDLSDLSDLSGHPIDVSPPKTYGKYKESPWRASCQVYRSARLATNTSASAIRRLPRSAVIPTLAISLPRTLGRSWSERS